MASEITEDSQIKDLQTFSPLPEDEEAPLKESESVTVFNFIKLNPGLSKQNFYCLIIHHVLLVLSISIPGAIQPLIILNPEYYNVPQEKAGKIHSIVLIVQLVVKLCVSIPYGHLVDRLGRKFMIHYGALSFLVGCLIISSQTSIFPGFIFGQFFITNATSALFSVPLSADYIADESKGKASAFLFMFFGFGGLAGNLIVKALFHLEISLGKCYVIIGLASCGAFFLNTLGLKSHYKHLIVHGNTAESRESLINKIKEAMQIFKSNGWLKILLVVQILGSSDFHVFFSLFAVFTKSLFPKDVDEHTQNLVVNNIQTFVSIPMILANIVYGSFLDKKHMIIKILVFALGGGSVSFLFIAFSKDPYAWTIKFGAILLGSTLPGLFTISSYLGIKNYPPDKRGLMSGISGIMGTIGYFVLATTSGVLYDSWRKDGPFLICSGLLIVAIILVIKIYRNMSYN